MFALPSESIEINWNLSQNWVRCGNALIFFEHNTNATLSLVLNFD